MSKSTFKNFGLYALICALSIGLLLGCPNPAGASGATGPQASTIVFKDSAPLALVSTGSYTNSVTGGQGTGAITYTSSTPATATINPATGEVSLIAAGTTKITASKAASPNFSAVSQSYTLVVKDFGSPHQGGLIAYVLVPGDPGYDANTPHGLIMATAGIGNGYWAEDNYIGQSLPTSTGFGSGQANTAAIVAQNAAANYTAGKMCDVYVNADTGTGVYTDWYLPSVDELSKIYPNKGKIGGFSFKYWSSSEYNFMRAWVLNFDNGSTGPLDKDYVAAVRPVRSF